MSNASNISELEKAEHLSVGNGAGVKRTATYETDGSSLLQKTSTMVSKKITSPDANTFYIASAPIGTAQSSASWQVKKVLTTGADTVITWADGNANFDNVATDLTSLSYS